MFVIKRAVGNVVVFRWYDRADSRFALSIRDTVLLCNDVSHWLCASLKLTLYEDSSVCGSMRRHRSLKSHEDVIKWKHFPRYWPFVRGILRSPVNSRHKGQWRGALMFSLICAWINDRANNREVGDLRRHHAHYDVTVTKLLSVVNSEVIPTYTFA